MIQFAGIGVDVLKGLVETIIEDPDTYKKIESVRMFLSELTGVEIDQNGLVALLEGATQGEQYTGQWEECDPHNNQSHARRMRVAGGWIYDLGRGNPIFVSDGR